MALGRLYLVTDRRVAEAAGRALEDAVADALDAVPWGGALVQLREKDLGDDELIELGRRLGAACRLHGAPLLVNASARLEVAAAIGADGVHLPEAGPTVAEARAAAARAGRSWIVGRSVHGAAAAAAAARDGADLIACGPVWDTPSKRELGAPLGVAALRDAVAAAGDVPVFAIGGIDDAARAAEARAAGAHGVALIRGALGAADVGAATRAIAAALG